MARDMPRITMATTKWWPAGTTLLLHREAFRPGGNTQITTNTETTKTEPTANKVHKHMDHYHDCTSTNECTDYEHKHTTSSPTQTSALTTTTPAEADIQPPPGLQPAQTIDERFSEIHTFMRELMIQTIQYCQQLANQLDKKIAAYAEKPNVDKILTFVERLTDEQQQQQQQQQALVTMQTRVDSFLDRYSNWLPSIADQVCSLDTRTKQLNMRMLRLCMDNKLIDTRCVSDGAL